MRVFNNICIIESVYKDRERERERGLIIVMHLLRRGMHN